MRKKNKTGSVRSTNLPHVCTYGIRNGTVICRIFGTVRDMQMSLPELWLHKILKQHIRNFEASRVHITGFSQHAFHKDKGSSKYGVHIYKYSTQESQIVQNMPFSEPKILRRIPSHELQIFDIMSFSETKIPPIMYLQESQIVQNMCFSELKILHRMPGQCSHRSFAACLSQSGRFFQTCIYRNHRLFKARFSDPSFFAACLYKVHESQIFCSISFSKT